MDPVFAFPTLFPQLTCSPPNLRVRFPSLTRVGFRRPKPAAPPSAFPFDSTVRDFRHILALEDIKYTKITHGRIGTRSGKTCDILLARTAVEARCRSEAAIRRLGMPFRYTIRGELNSIAPCVKLVHFTALEADKVLKITHGGIGFADSVTGRQEARGRKGGGKRSGAAPPHPPPAGTVPGRQDSLRSLRVVRSLRSLRVVRALRSLRSLREIQTPRPPRGGGR